MSTRIVLLAAAALVTALLVAGAVRVLQYDGVARPGVHVLGVDVSGKSRAQIASLVDDWDAQPVRIATRSQSYQVPRGWLVAVDAAATARRALASGALSSLVVAKRVDVAPVVLGRAPSAGNILGVLARAGRPAVSATVRVAGTRVVVTPSQTGLRLARSRLLGLLERDGSRIRAPFASVAPQITSEAAAVAAKQARLLVAGPIAVDFHGARRGVLTPGQIARAVRIVPTGRVLAVSLDGESLTRLLRPRLGAWIRRARNARFVVAAKAVRIVPSQPGRDVDPAQVVTAVEAAAAGDRIARIELGPHAAALTTAKAKALGIRQRLVSYTTQMGPSSSNRIHNVHLMADFIDGTLIRPGQVFSFNAVVGPRTAERGFLEGQEIIGSLVLPSIGGGVCQTATTLFNDAFETGLPILERTNHNLYLSHYPLGRDATVAWGGPDLKFRNDLKHGIYIKASYTDQTLTFAFYGTPEGRRVVAHTGPQVKWTRPSMNFAVDPRAAPGSVQVFAGSGELGFDVTVSRTVSDAAGKVLRKDAFRSHYIPDSPTTVYGPGATPPGPYIVLPVT